MKNLICIIFAIVLLLNYCAKAQFPAEEVWRVDIDDAKRLSEPWTDEEGNYCFAVGTCSQLLMPGYLEIIAMYPNPFNSMLNVSYSLTVPSQVRIGLFNSKGSQIRVYQPGMQTAGIHKLVLNSNDLGTGIYFLRIETLNSQESRKIVYLK